MKRRTAATVFFLLASSFAHADQRLYCATDGPALKASFEVEFDEALGGRLIHFRGVAVVKGAGVPPALRDVVLTSRMLTQQWRDGREMRLRIYDAMESDKGTEAIDFSVSAGRIDAAQSRARYALALVTRPPGANARRSVLLRTEGDLVCTAK